MVPNRIFDMKLRPRELAVYCCLLRHCDESMTCYPSRSLIGTECCIDRKTVDLALKNLSAAGLVSCEHRHRQDGYYVRKVFEQCVREGKGSHVLAEYLNKNGVRTHNGAKFQATTILRMLANKTYCGYYVTGEISSKKIEDIAIVDEEIWHRIFLNRESE